MRRTSVPGILLAVLLVTIMGCILAVWFSDPAGAAPSVKCYWGIQYEASLGVWEWAYHAWVHNDPTIPPDIYRLYRNRPAAQKCIRKHAEGNHPGVAFRAFKTAAPRD